MAQQLTLLSRLDTVRYEYLGMKMPLGLRDIKQFQGRPTEMVLVECAGLANAWQKWVPVQDASRDRAKGKKGGGSLLTAVAARLWVPNEHEVLLADVRAATRTKGYAADPLASDTARLYHKAKTLARPGSVPNPGQVRNLEAETSYYLGKGIYAEAQARDGNPVGQYGFGVTHPLGERETPKAYFATDNRGGVISTESWQGVVATLDAMAHVASTSKTELVVVRNTMAKGEAAVKAASRS